MKNLLTALIILCGPVYQCLAVGGTYGNIHYAIDEGKKQFISKDLKTNKQTVVSFETAPHDLVIHKNYAYIFHQRNSKTKTYQITRINLSTHAQQIYASDKQSRFTEIHNETIVCAGTYHLLFIDGLNEGFEPVLAEIKEPIGTKTAIKGSNYLFSLNAEGDTVTIFDIRKKAAIRTFTTGMRPVNATEYYGFLYVVNSGSNTLTVIDLEDLKIIKTIPVGKKPFDVVPHHDHLYILNYNDKSISVVDTKSLCIVRTIPCEGQGGELSFTDTHISRQGPGAQNFPLYPCNPTCHTIPILAQDGMLQDYLRLLLPNFKPKFKFQYKDLSILTPKLHEEFVNFGQGCWEQDPAKAQSALASANQEVEKLLNHLTYLLGMYTDINNLLKKYNNGLVDYNDFDREFKKFKKNIGNDDLTVTKFESDIKRIETNHAFFKTFKTYLQREFIDPLAASAASTSSTASTSTASTSSTSTSTSKTPYVTVSCSSCESAPTQDFIIDIDTTKEDLNDSPLLRIRHKDFICTTKAGARSISLSSHNKPTVDVRVKGIPALIIGCGDYIVVSYSDLKRIDFLSLETKEIVAGCDLDFFPAGMGVSRATSQFYILKTNGEALVLNAKDERLFCPLKSPYDKKGMKIINKDVDRQITSEIIHDRLAKMYGR